MVGTGACVRFLALVTSIFAVDAQSTTVAPSPASVLPPTGDAVIDEVVQVLGSANSANVFQYQKADNTWAPSDVYTWNDMMAAVRKMATVGIGPLKLWLGGDSPVYGLVNVAAFLAQVMHETIKYNACDENNWSDSATMAGRGAAYPASAACGQLGQSYQNYECSAEENALAGGNMACEVDPDMEERAFTRAHWYGAPPEIFCAPKSKVPKAPRWNFGGWCSPEQRSKYEEKTLDEYFDYVNSAGTCEDYEDQKAGYWDFTGSFCSEAGCANMPAPLFSTPARTDVEGCCWWGRGAIQTSGVCNFGKLNYYLGKRAASEGRDALYPDIDFCRSPGSICDPSSPHDLKWVAGFFYWLNAVQPYAASGWNYGAMLRAWVDNGMDQQDTGFIDGVSGIVNRGCPLADCGTGPIDGLQERRNNFKVVLDALGPLEPGSPATTPPPAPTPQQTAPQTTAPTPMPPRPTTAPTPAPAPTPVPTRTPTTAPTPVSPPPTTAPTSAPAPTPMPAPPTIAPTSTPVPTLVPAAAPPPTSSTAADLCSAAGPPCDIQPGEGISSWFTKDLFNQMFPNLCSTSCRGCELLKYECLIRAAAAYPQFANSGSADDNKRELAAWLGEMSHETTGGGCGSSTELPDGTCSCGGQDWCVNHPNGGCASWGLCFVREAGGTYCSQNSVYPCAAGAGYRGRGPIQLSWNYNYGQFSEDFCGDKNVLLDDPDRVASNPTLAWASSMWFWFTGGACLPGETNCKPNCHEVFMGTKPMCSSDLAANRQYGLGWVTNIINGGLECGGGGNGKCDYRVHDRVRYYEHFCDILGVDPLKQGWTEDGNLYCSEQKNYNTVPAQACSPTVAPVPTTAPQPTPASPTAQPLPTQQPQPTAAPAGDCIGVATTGTITCTSCLASNNICYELEEPWCHVLAFRWCGQQQTASLPQDSVGNLRGNRQLQREIPFR